MLDVYAEDGMTLDQLMAFTVSPDHERQDQVWEATQRSYNKEPYQIRRLHPSAEGDGACGQAGRSRLARCCGSGVDTHRR
jgi:hypothetical protein